MDAQKGTPYILAQPAREQRRVRLSSSDIETEPALELLIQRTSPAAPGSSGSHRPDGTTSHLVPASKDVSNQHLVAAARRRQQLRQDKGFEAELDHRRPEELQRRPDGMMAFARGGRDAAQATRLKSTFRSCFLTCADLGDWKAGHGAKASLKSTGKGKGKDGQGKDDCPVCHNCGKRGRLARECWSARKA
ncbi:unnamed protein product [Durusdinium trenchii]|uniref:CCHC-type domain-containing protein n=1 Tax=Durusdinium trenchii TaxID=1381693 RepID=A0ABP0J5M8_9DINO